MLRRLSNMQPFENAYVPYGANRRTFAIRKAGGYTMPHLPKIEDLEKALTSFQEIVTVMKNGAPLDDAAAEQLTERLDAIADAILPPGEAQPTVADGKTLKQLLEKICKDLSQLAVEAQASDYALGDRTDALLADAQLARDMIDTAAAVPPPAAPPAPPAADPPPASDPPPAVPPQAVAPPAADPPPAAPPAADPPPAVDPPPPAPPAPTAVAPPAADPPPAVPPVVPPADPPLPMIDPRYATKDDITALANQVKSLITEALKPVQELKSALSMAPGSRPMVSPAPAAPQEGYSPAEMLDMAASPDLDTMVDEYGRIKE